MADIKIFNYQGKVEELKSSGATIEKELQNIIEQNMLQFFGVRFLASEYQIDNGRMDSIGLDENNCPVIFEYKRASNENVINQGLFYLTWLLGHKANFELLVLKELGQAVSDMIDWTMPRVICIAGDFNKYDEEAIKQINRNVSLIRYKKFGSHLLMFEQLNSVSNCKIDDIDEIKSRKNNRPCDKDFDVMLTEASHSTQSLYEDVRLFVLSLGDDVTENKVKLYTAFKKIKNFTCVEVKKQHLILRLNIDPASIHLVDGFTRDCSDIGHWGTGNLEVRIKDKNDFEQSKALILRSYEEN